MGSRESDDSLKINLKDAVIDTTALKRAIALIILGAFAIVILAYKTQSIVEKSRFELTTENIKSGLRLKVAKLIASDQLGGIKQLVGSNPVILLDRLPDKYVGVIESVNNKNEEGTWWFEPHTGELVYKFHKIKILHFLNNDINEGRLSITARSESQLKDQTQSGVAGIELKVRVVNGS